MSPEFCNLFKSPAIHTKTEMFSEIDCELKLIEKLGLAGYFLVVRDIVLLLPQGILVPGRNSVANSTVCYALGDTSVDPIAMDLLF
jgi:error-prone DNA polymerase